jgi:hypothetical protein
MTTRLRAPLTPPPPSAEYVLAVHAFQALAKGEANADQQQRALNWVLHKFALVDESEFRETEREHVLTSGRRFVGLQIRKMLAAKTGDIR